MLVYGLEYMEEPVVESSFLLRLREMRMRMEAMTATIRMSPAIAMPMANVLGERQKVLGSATTSSRTGVRVSDAPSGSGTFCKVTRLLLSITVVLSLAKK